MLTSSGRLIHDHIEHGLAATFGDSSRGTRAALKERQVLTKYL